MFQFAGLLPFSIMNLREGTMRLPYSGISESMFVLNSSELFAVAHALHHLWVPRAPPNAFVLFNFYWIVLVFNFVTGLEVSGFEPLTFALQGQHSTNWVIPPLALPPWAIGDSNTWPRPYQGRTLTNWANSPYPVFFIIFVFFEEVIQPHLPVRLPCSDFTIVTDPTLGAFLLKG